MVLTFVEMGLAVPLKGTPWLWRHFCLRTHSEYCRGVLHTTGGVSVRTFKCMISLCLARCMCYVCFSGCIIFEQTYAWTRHDNSHLTPPKAFSQSPAHAYRQAPDGVLIWLFKHFTDRIRTLWCYLSCKN